MSSSEAPPVVRDDLGRRLDGLATAADAARGRVDDAALEPADALTGRAADRLRLSGEHTIVALAGATGSGKSSLFNALTGMELAGVGVRRPTTSWALACAWGPDGAAELLEWMGIPPRHQVSRMGMLERTEQDTSLEGLILLDLPDHDSTEVSHHLEMDRLVRFSDLLIWVLDPQKYADAAIHERYIRPMAAFGAVTLVVLNQIDRIPYEQRASAIADVKRLIEADGLPDVKVIGVSATRGDGLEELRRELAERIAHRSAAKARLQADVGEAAGVLADAGGSSAVPDVDAAVRDRFATALADTAGVPQLVEAVQLASRRRVVRRTSWPVARWLRRAPREHDAVPEVVPVQHASVDLAARDLVDDVTVDLAPPWRASVRRALRTDGDAGLGASLDGALAATDLGASRIPAWARLVQVAQWLLLLALLAGLGWLGALGLERWTDLQLNLPDRADDVVGGAPIAAWATGGVVAAAVLLDLLSRVAARTRARRRARRAAERLRAAVDQVALQRVVAPVEAELRTYGRYRDGLLTARP